MTVFSMTGYASVTEPVAGDASAGSAVSLELRSVNGRFLDLSFKMPDDLRHLEPALRELLSGELRRGKVELRLQTRRGRSIGLPALDPEFLRTLEKTQRKIFEVLHDSRPLSAQEVLQWCHQSQGAAADDQDLNQALNSAVLEAGRQALAALRVSRAREGEKLVQMLRERIAQLRLLADKAEPLVPAVVARQQQRFLERWQEVWKSAPAADAASAQDRAMQEATAYALRIDVAEELSRLRAHLEEIDHLLTQGGELGKRLDFMIQELHREANTLGSKSTALDLTGVSVDMKVLIEQMREQVQNIE